MEKIRAQATIPKPRILPVDDRPLNLTALAAILEDLDAVIVTTTSGNEALAQTLEQKLAVVLLDVQMPGMDGLQTRPLTGDALADMVNRWL